MIGRRVGLIPRLNVIGGRVEVIPRRIVIGGRIGWNIPRRNHAVYDLWALWGLSRSPQSGGM